jgi:hypothetical protein
MLATELSRGQQALQAIESTLTALPQDALLEPRLQLRHVLAEARDLAQVITRPGVRERLRGVGAEDEAMDALPLAIEALAECERRWARARDARKSLRQAQAEALAYPLRDEMVAACRYHLDGVAVLELLARVTDGENTGDLVQDLRELASFLRDNAGAFAGDASFDPVARAVEAAELGASVAVDLEPTQEALIHLELRDRAFTHLCGLVERVRRAGRYAYRGKAEARWYFSTITASARPRRPLPSAVRALAV